jgi:transcriptional regulator with XRE-family HTH domain
MKAARSEVDTPGGTDAVSAGSRKHRLGSSIRSTRILKGLKLREVAERAACSESLLSKVENGHANPSLAVLERVADALQVSVATLLSPVDHTRIVARAGERAVVRIDGRGSRAERLIPAGQGHLLEGHLHVLAAGAGSEGTLAHEGEEVGYVISGRLRLTLGNEAYDLDPGDSFAFRSEIPHRYINPGTTQTRIIWVSTPSRISRGPV